MCDFCMPKILNQKLFNGCRHMAQCARLSSSSSVVAAGKNTMQIRTRYDFACQLIVVVVVVVAVQTGG